MSLSPSQEILTQLISFLKFRANCPKIQVLLLEGISSDFIFEDRVAPYLVYLLVED
jgi:hypothetical protein